MSAMCPSLPVTMRSAAGSSPSPPRAARSTSRPSLSATSALRTRGTGAATRCVSSWPSGRTRSARWGRPGTTAAEADSPRRPAAVAPGRSARRPGSVAGEAALTPLGEAAQPLSCVLAVQDARQQREKVPARRVWAAAASCARVGQRALDAERRLPGDQLGQFPRPLEVQPGRYDLLDQPDPQRLGGAELLGGEQEAHRVAPAELRGCAEGGAAERHDPAADLQLAKAYVFSGH